MTAENGAVLSVLLDFEAVAALIGRKPDGSTRTWLARRVAANDFPVPRQASPNRIAWLRSEVDAWINSRPPVKYAPEARDAA